MPVITKLSAQLRDPARVNVFLDGKYAFSLSAEEVIKRGLKVSQPLSTPEVSDLSALSKDEKVFAKVINFISYRPRSEREVMDRLYQYLGPDEKEAKEALVKKLQKLGYLNDLEFARWFAQSRRANRPRSIRQLASELYAKGIGKEVISQVLGEEGDDREAIEKLIAKKSNLEPDKLAAYLARKGFSWEIIKEELDKMAQSG